VVFGRKKRRIVRLLVVEDEPLVAFDNEHALSDAGFEIVATVPGVESAIAALGDGVDLVVSDIRLADGSGLDVARAAREAGIPVLFVSGLCPDGAEELAAGCLSKPYQPKDLVNAITAVDAMLAGERVRRVPAGLTLFDALSPSGEREGAA
jgi:DNA-binding response OmpR family regulator